MPVPPKSPKSQPVRSSPKPLHRPGPTAPTHSRVPVHQAVAGRLFRVRDKDWAALWGEDLSWDDAVKLKDTVVGERRSKTARVEDMEIEAPEWFKRSGRADPEPQRVVFGEHRYEAMSEAQIIDHCGDDAHRWAEAFMEIQGALPAEQIDLDTMRGWFANAIEAAIDVRQRRQEAAVRPNASLRIPFDRGGTSPPAISASAAAAQSAQQRHEQQRARVTFTPSEPPKPPPSPLTDAVVDDIEPGELPPDDEMFDDEDLAGLTAEVGGNPTETDAVRAKVQADKELAELEQKAKALYDQAKGKISLTGEVGNMAMLKWEGLPEKERAAWRFEAAHGVQNGGPR